MEGCAAGPHGVVPADRGPFRLHSRSSGRHAFQAHRTNHHARIRAHPVDDLPVFWGLDPVGKQTQNDRCELFKEMIAGRWFAGTVRLGVRVTGRQFTRCRECGARDSGGGASATLQSGVATGGRARLQGFGRDNAPGPFKELRQRAGFLHVWHVGLRLYLFWLL